jgi:hypothetical protein
MERLVDDFAMLRRARVSGDLPPEDGYNSLKGRLSRFALNVSLARRLVLPPVLFAGKAVRAWLIPGDSGFCLLLELPALIDVGPAYVAHCASIDLVRRGNLVATVLRPENPHMSVLIGAVPDGIKTVGIYGVGSSRVDVRFNGYVAVQRDPVGIRLRLRTGRPVTVHLG